MPVMAPGPTQCHAHDPANPLVSKVCVGLSKLCHLRQRHERDRGAAGAGAPSPDSAGTGNGSKSLSVSDHLSGVVRYLGVGVL